MTAIAYPATLPGPQPGSFAPRPRRAASSIDGSLQQRARQRDAAGLASQYTYVYTPDQMAAWLAWYRDTLLDGRRWFAHALPGPDGLVQRVVRYRDVRQQLIGVGIYRVSASFEQRGAGVMPDFVDPPMPPMFWTADGPWAMSGGDKIAAIGGFLNEFPHAYYNLQGSRFQAGGRVYWEVDLDDHSSSSNDVGWCGFVTPTGHRLACTYDGDMLESTGGVPNIYFLPVTDPFNNAPEWHTQRLLMFAVDVDAGQVWIGADGSWLLWLESGSPDLPDPATGFKPYPMIFQMSEPIRPEIYHLPHHPNFNCRLRSAASEMAFPIPAGFVAIGGD